MLCNTENQLAYVSSVDCNTPRGNDTIGGYNYLSVGPRPPKKKAQHGHRTGQQVVFLCIVQSNTESVWTEN